MSFLVSTKIQEMQLELNVLGQAMDDDDFMLFLNKANEYIQTGYKMPTTERAADLLLFNGVNEYPLPSDFAGIIEPKRPYGLTSPYFKHRRDTDFVHDPVGRITGFKHSRDTQFLLANETEGSKTLFNACDSLTGNGTWAVSGDGASLALDQQIFTEGTGSLKFTVTASGGTTTLTCTGMNPVDITDFLLQYLFLDLGCPASNTTAITSVRLRVGSDSTNYYQATSTTRYRGDSILNAFGLIGFDMSGKSTTGTPDDDQIDYIQILITHGTTGVDGAYHLDNIFAAESVYYILPYYSQYNIKDDDGSTYKAAIVETGDTVLCPNGVEFSSVYTYKALEIAAAMRFHDAPMAAYCARELEPREKYLKAKYATQESPLTSSWYRQNRNR